MSLVHLHKSRLWNIFNALDRSGSGLVGLTDFDRLFALYNASASIAASHLLQYEVEGLLLNQEIEQMKEVIAVTASICIIRIRYAGTGDR